MDRGIIPTRIIQARVAKGYLKQTDAVENTEFSRQVLSLWENGKVEPSGEMYRALADAYDVSVDWLMGRDLETPGDAASYLREGDQL